jgi:glycosyltransferase involved in cell wall biosynthesis
MGYGLLCALTGVDSKQVMSEVFIDEAKPDQWRWRIKTRLYAWIAGRALGIITNSSIERETMAMRYQLPIEHFIFVPLCGTIPPEPDSPEAEPALVVSAGRTLRDFDLMLKAAPAIGAPVVVIAGRDDLPGIIPPPGVTILREINRSDYLDYLRRAAVVALPLKSTERATGQVVMFEAMAMGKPVVTTRSPGTIDTIRHNENGWLIEAGDPSALSESCRHLLADAGLRRRLGDAAREDMRRHYSYDAHAQSRWDAIVAFWQKQQ